MPTTPRYWGQRDGLALLLLPLSKLFESLVALRRALYRHGWLESGSVPAKVIVIGNITAGGTGKTPLVQYLARDLKARGMKPGIVTRGYGGSRPGESEVNVTDSPKDVGDEAALLARTTHCPVWRGIDRLTTARKLLAAHPECDVILSDDGLQHYRLARDIEIAVVDGARGFFNGLALPAGPLREPLTRLNTCDFVIVKEPIKHDMPKVDFFRMRLRTGELINVADHGKTTSTNDLAQRHVHAVAGIGNPEQFFDALRAMKLDITPHAFDDHHDFKPSDLNFATDDELIVMTQKDAVKCEAFARPNFWALPVIAEIDPGFVEQLLVRLHHGHRSKTA